MRKPRRKKDQSTTYLRADQFDKLNLLRERTGYPVAQYIREGVDMVLAKYAQPGAKPPVPKCARCKDLGFIDNDLWPLYEEPCPDCHPVHKLKEQEHESSEQGVPPSALSVEQGPEVGHQDGADRSDDGQPEDREDR